MFKRNSCAVIMLLCSGGLAHAREEGTIELGAFTVTPSLDSAFRYIDNVAYASSEEDEIDSWSLSVTPNLNAYTEFNGNRIAMDYRLARGEYFSSDADNYTDHHLLVSSEFTIDNRNRVNATISYKDLHDERGRRYSNGIGNQLTEVDTFKNSEALVTYSYGALSASGRFDVAIGFEQIDYDNDSLFYLIRDREILSYNAVFQYRLWKYTNLVIDGSRREIDYDFDADPENSFDSVENSVLTGLNWNYNDVTQSFAKFGYREKAFESTLRDDFSGFTWEVGIRYLPLSYSEFTLSTRQGTRETNTDADYIRTANTQVSWKHNWAERFSTTASVTLVNDDYEGSVENLRTDDVTTFGISANYTFRRWLTIGVSYSTSERDSNRNQFDYDRDVYSLTARITL